MEKWKAIPGWEGFYEVSDAGRIRSVDRIIAHGRSGTMSIKGKELKQHREDDGSYFHVTLSRPGRKPKCFNTHIVVLTSFIGPPSNGLVGCHGPGGNSDNTLFNLRWDTRSENELDKYRWNRK